MAPAANVTAVSHPRIRWCTRIVPVIRWWNTGAVLWPPHDRSSRGRTGARWCGKGPIVAGDQDVALTFDDMRDFGAHLAAEQERFDRELRELQTQVQELTEGGFSTREASVAFEEVYEEFTTNVTQLLESMTGLGNFLNMAADGFEGQDIDFAAAVRGS
ncbi:WXG100 family type VII secretion target [Streptomyces xiamenensis]|uniref:WXG100 family type VII secretion target n=1 Tax=Streptomyces xiamenensis TaxID=408015 RepID=UPI0037D5C4C5